MATTGKNSATGKKTTKAAPAVADQPAPSKTTAKAAAKTEAKTAPKPAAKATTAAAPKTAAKTSKAGKAVKTPLDAQQRRHYVEVAAYFMAERRGFMTGCEHEDWLAAEAEIDRLFLEGKLNA
jgi:outer membrane biosynthesis protein TonB